MIKYFSELAKGMVKILSRNILTFSTLHISSTTRYILKNHIENLDLLIYPKDDHGYFIMVDLEKTEVSKIPNDLLYLLRLAHMHDCYYLELDDDYPPEDDVLLTVYDRTIAEEVSKDVSNRES
ncbi:hypothetical protein AN161_17855 [Lysinibacillus sp. FJAT-14222]|nr:hypothetical protein AN161_17855 [Lysinibacillus sp. FJAT-14222]